MQMLIVFRISASMARLQRVQCHGRIASMIRRQHVSIYLGEYSGVLPQPGTGTEHLDLSLSKEDYCKLIRMNEYQVD